MTVVPAVNQIQYHVGMGSDPVRAFLFARFFSPFFGSQPFPTERSRFWSRLR